MKNNTTKAPLILATLNADGDEIPFRRGASPVTSNVTQQTTIIATLDDQGNPVPISMSEIDDFTTEDKAKLDKLGEDPDTGAPTWNGELIDDTSKADRAVDAVEGNFAALDADGNPTDSGKKPTDFLEVNDYKPQIIVDTFNDLPTDKIPGTEARVLTSVANSTTGIVTSLEEGDILDAVEIPETMALVGNPIEEEEGLLLIKEGSAGEDSYEYALSLYMQGSNLVFVYTVYSVTSGDDDEGVRQDFVYTPEAFIGTGDFEGVEFSAGWNLVDEEVPSASSVLFSEVPLIENGVTVDDVGAEAVLVYPYLQITMDVIKPEGRYILNSSSTWVLLDYASRQLVDTKVDKETGMGLSTNDYDDSAAYAVGRIITTGDGEQILTNNGNYVRNLGVRVVSSYADLDSIADKQAVIAYVINDDETNSKGFYFYDRWGRWTSFASLDEIYVPGVIVTVSEFTSVGDSLYQASVSGGFAEYDTAKYTYSIMPNLDATGANSDKYHQYGMYLRKITPMSMYVGATGDPGTTVELLITRQLRQDL